MEWGPKNKMSTSFFELSLGGFQCSKSLSRDCLSKTDSRGTREILCVGDSDLVPSLLKGSYSRFCR